MRIMRGRIWRKNLAHMCRVSDKNGIVLFILLVYFAACF